MPKLPKDKAKRVDDAESSFAPLEEGMYVGTLMEVTGDHQGPSGEYWVWRFGELFAADEEDWEDPTYAPGNQWLNTSLSEAAEWKLQEVFAAFGSSPDTDTDELIGERIRLVISQREIEKGPRMGQLNNNIDACLPLYDEEESEPEPEPEKPKSRAKATAGRKK